MRLGSPVDVRPKWVGMMPHGQRYDVLLTAWMADRLPVAGDVERKAIKSFLNIAAKFKANPSAADANPVVVIIRQGNRNGTYRLSLYRLGVGPVAAACSLETAHCPKLDALYRESRTNSVEIIPDPVASRSSSDEVSKGFPSKPMTQLVP